MGFTSKVDTSFSAIAGSHFEEFALLADCHKDGWGYATDDSLVKEVSPATQSRTFRDAVDVEEKAALLHFRLATNGFPINENNSHPFKRDGISFIHNGAITPSDFLIDLIEPKLLPELTGVTDSEKYFFNIVTQIEKLGLIDGVLTAVRNIKNNLTYSSINAMLLTPEKYVVVCEHNNEKIPEGEGSDYYELYYRKDEMGILVSSTGWNQTGWTLIPNHSVVVIDRKNFTIELISL